MTIRKDIITFLFLLACLTSKAQTTIEAEDGTYSNCELVYDDMYSGGKALRMTQTNSRLTLSIPEDEGGKYRIMVCGCGIGGDKIVNCVVIAAQTPHQRQEDCHFI